MTEDERHYGSMRETKPRMVLVPVEPTEAMLKSVSGFLDEDWAQKVYAAMLKAAQGEQ